MTWGPKEYAVAATKINDAKNPLYVWVDGHEVKEVNFIAKLLISLLTAFHFYSEKELHHIRLKLFEQLNKNYQGEVGGSTEVNPGLFGAKLLKRQLQKKLGAKAEILEKGEGFVVREPATGASLFYAVADGLRLLDRSRLPDEVLLRIHDKEELAKYLREIARDYIQGASGDETMSMLIKKQIDAYNRLPNRPEEDMIQDGDDYIDRLSDPHFSASGLELFALSKVLNLSMEIMGTHPKTTSADLWILFTPSQGHYEAYFPKPVSSERVRG